MPDRDQGEDQDEGLLGLADAVEGLRHELTRAIERGDAQRERLRFKLSEPLVLEVQAVVTKVGQGKVGWKVVELGGSYTAANTHKITLTLSPEWWSGEAYSADFLISASLPASADGDGPIESFSTQVGESGDARQPDPVDPD